MALKLGSRVRSKVFSARLRGAVEELVTTPTAHRFFGDTFARVRHDHGLVMWTPTGYLSGPGKDAYEGFYKDRAAGWAGLAADGSRLLPLLAGVYSPYSHVRNDMRFAGLFDRMSPEDGARALLGALRALDPASAREQVPPPDKPYANGDYKGFSSAPARSMIEALLGGWEFAARHASGGGALAGSFSDPALADQLAAAAAKLGIEGQGERMREELAPLGPQDYGGSPSAAYAAECGLDARWGLCSGTGF